MKVIITKDYKEMSAKAAEEIIKQVKEKPDSVLGLATGQTPVGMYEQLVDVYNNGKVNFEKVTSFNLDEYIGLSKDDQDSYYSYMYGNLFAHINMRSANINMLDGMSNDLVLEGEKYEKKIAEKKIDLQVLGIGTNGHIGFCEPGTSFDSKTHVVNLAERTKQNNEKRLVDIEKVPDQAITMGIGTIMRAKHIILLASGEYKKEIIEKSLHGDVTEDVPASILQKHPNVTIIIDELASSK